MSEEKTERAAPSFSGSDNLLRLLRQCALHPPGRSAQQQAWRSHEGQNPLNLISGQNPTRNQCEPSLVSCFLQRFQPNVFIAGLPCSKRDRLYTVDISNSKRDRQGHEGPASVVSALPSQRGTHSSVLQSLSVCGAAFACTALGRDWLRSLRSLKISSPPSSSSEHSRSTGGPLLVFWGVAEDVRRSASRPSG